MVNAKALAAHIEDPPKHHLDRIALSLILYSIVFPEANTKKDLGKDVHSKVNVDGEKALTMAGGPRDKEGNLAATDSAVVERAAKFKIYSMTIADLEATITLMGMVLTDADADISMEDKDTNTETLEEHRLGNAQANQENR